MEMKGCLFDLDGVIVDTAKYHFLAWKKLAGELDIHFTEEDNELLKGVSRMRSLEIILELGQKSLTEEEKAFYAEKKNKEYLHFIHQMNKDELLPGAEGFIRKLKGEGIRVALGSASKNARLILQRLEVEDLFDAVIDGNAVSNAKPDPEVFLKGAEAVQVAPAHCVVFEDAVAGIEAAKNAGMFCVGVGDAAILRQADLVIPGFEAFSLEILSGVLQKKSVRTLNAEK